MTCESVGGLLSAYHDGELDFAQMAEVSAHVAGCHSCTAALEGVREMSRMARDPGLYHSPPPYLEARIRSALRDTLQETPGRSTFWRWAGIAATLVAAAGLAWSLIALRSARSDRSMVADEVVAHHIQSLLATHLFDVPSTDRHTVKPWFDGKLDFSPDVKDLASQGFRLAGGRLDYLDGRQVAALVFQRRLHVINLFVWPSAEAAVKPGAVPAGGQHGYNVVHWTSGGMTYWAVADIPAAELEEFGRLYGE